MPIASCSRIQLHAERGSGGSRLLFCLGSGPTIVSTRGRVDRLFAHFAHLGFDERGMEPSAAGNRLC